MASVLAHGVVWILAQSLVHEAKSGPTRVQLRLATPSSTPAPPGPPKAAIEAESAAGPPAASPGSPARRPSRVARRPSAPPTGQEAGPPSEAQAGAGTSANLGGDQGQVMLPVVADGTEGAGSGGPGPNLKAQLSPPGPELLPPPAPLAPKIALSPRAGGGYVYRDRGFQAEIAQDGTVEFDDHLPVQLGGESTGGVPVATFDLTEAVMMIVGDDPYRADKERFLAATVELRQGLCEAAHQERLRTALFELDRNLDAIWQDQRRAATARRELLFQLWDECLEPAPDTTDLTERTALQARATILEYIQKNLPAGSPLAYPEQELLALNQRRRSKAPFDPYRSERDAGAGCE